MAFKHNFEEYQKLFAKHLQELSTQLSKHKLVEVSNYPN